MEDLVEKRPCSQERERQVAIQKTVDVLEEEAGKAGYGVMLETMKAAPGGKE